MTDDHAEPTRPYRERTVPFTAGDGFACNLIHVQGERAPSKGPVILVHGAGVRANIFRAPVETTIVDYLIEHGYDVWLENWRASIDLPRNPWTLDQAAAYDHPEAVKTVVRETGWDKVKAVIHCQGSTSFMMSAVAGLTPNVKTVITNAVSLHPIVKPLARAKISVLLRMPKPKDPYLNPQWGRRAPTLLAKLIALYVALTHHECDNSVCKHASFTYGVGFPTLWRHEQLNPATHDWLTQEFAHVPRSFFVQIARCIRRGHLVSMGGAPIRSNGRLLPTDFVAQPPETDARFAFFAGAMNQCFRPESQRKTFAYFDSLRKGYHALHVLPGYAHLDVFMGKDAARDVFPLMLQELDKPN
jgi:pimeloyl-ACP methyl ester carboxylesterase